MNQQDWLELWQKQQHRSFHRDYIHPSLLAFKETLNLPPTARIFIPLCGMSHDIHYLSMCYDCVIGIEISEIAITSFFKHYELEYTQATVSGLPCYSWQNIHLFCGDIFACPASLVGPVDLVYDRAALIALPKPQRQDYSSFIQALRPKKQLLVSIEYDHANIQSAPYSVDDAEIRQHYTEEGVTIQCLKQEIILPEPGRALHNRGISKYIEKTYLISARP